MSSFDLVALLLLMTAAAGLINYRWLHLSSTTGLLVIALVFSLGVSFAAHLLGGSDLRTWMFHTLLAADFPKLHRARGAAEPAAAAPHEIADGADLGRFAGRPLDCVGLEMVDLGVAAQVI